MRKRSPGVQPRVGWGAVSPRSLLLPWETSQPLDQSSPGPPAGPMSVPIVGSPGNKRLSLTCPRTESLQHFSAHSFIHSFELLPVPFTYQVPPSSLLPPPCLPVLVSLGCPSKMPHMGDLFLMEAEKSKAKGPADCHLPI